jgi:predicted lipase
MRTIPYSAAKSDLFTPFQRGQYFMNNEAKQLSSLCAELSRLAYCRQATNKSFDTNQIHAVLQRIGFTDRAFIESPDAAVKGGTHCFVATGLTEDPASQVAIVVFRGTDADDPTNIGTDADAILKRWDRGVHVHTGFADALESVWTQLDQALQPINLPVLFTGHSLGAALATLAASRYKAADHNVSLYTYGSPLVGAADFVATLNSVPSFRYRDCCDAVTRVPPEALGYHHVGPPHYIDRDGTISINPSNLSIERDRIAGEIEYAAEYALKPGNVRIRDLADHSPINYVFAVTAANKTT